MDSMLIVKIVFVFTALVLFYSCWKHIREHNRKKKVLNLVVSIIGDECVHVNSIKATLESARLNNGKGIFYEMNRLTLDGYLECTVDLNRNKPTCLKPIIYYLTDKGKAHLETIISDESERN